MYHTTYLGVNIYRNTCRGYKLPWYTVSPGFAADTLQGIKSLIRQSRVTRKG